MKKYLCFCIVAFLFAIKGFSQVMDTTHVDSNQILLIGKYVIGPGGATVVNNYDFIYKSKKYNIGFTGKSLQNIVKNHPQANLEIKKYARKRAIASITGLAGIPFGLLFVTDKPKMHYVGAFVGLTITSLIFNGIAQKHVGRSVNYYNSQFK